MCLGLKLMTEFNLDEIRELLKSNDSVIANRAIRTAIANIPRSEPLLHDLYAVHCTSSSPANASDASSAIRRYKSFAVPFLLGLLGSCDAIDRRNAIHLLLGLGHNRSCWRIGGQTLEDRPDSQPDWGSQHDLVIRQLNSALVDPDLDVRVTAAVSLDDINETPVLIVKLLIEGLDSDDIWVQNISALHLGRLGAIAKDALPALNRFVESNLDPPNGIMRPVLAAKRAVDRVSGS